jgi:cytoskeletal protein RodZ
MNDQKDSKQKDSKQKKHDWDRDSNSKLNFIIIVVSGMVIWICFLIWINGMSKDHDNDKQSENETATVRVFKANDSTISGAQFNSVPLGVTEQQVKEQFVKPYG